MRNRYNRLQYGSRWYQPYILISLFAFVSLQCQTKSFAQSCLSSKQQKKFASIRMSSAPAQSKVKDIQALFDKCPSNEPLLDELLFLQKQLNDQEGMYQTLMRYTSAADNPSWKQWYELGELQFNRDALNEAKVSYQKANQICKNSQGKFWINLGLQNIAFTRAQFAHPENIAFRALPAVINSEYSDYLPMLNAAENFLLFTRRRGFDEQLLYSRKDEMGVWSEPKPIQGIDPKYATASVSCSPDGRSIILSIKNHPLGKGDFDLFQIVYHNGKWLGPYPLQGNINTRYEETQACLSADGRTLYFTSKRPDGKGENDIYVSYRDFNGKWSAGKNVEALNTMGDDESPFLHRDNVSFYFRSNGRAGMGDFDVYLSRKNSDGSWGTVENLGYPINTKGSEGGFYTYMSGDSAIVCTDAVKGTPEHKFNKQIDMYAFALPSRFQPKPNTFVEVRLIDAITKETLDGAVALIDVASADTLNWGMTYATWPMQFSIEINKGYNLWSSAENYVPKGTSVVISEAASRAENNKINIELMPISTEETVVPDEEIVLQNVQFESNQSVILPISYDELNRVRIFLNENQTVQIEIQGHTDDVGTEADNSQLSEDRAMAIKTYLVEKGVAADRISAVGYGESKPIADNATEAGRAKNRRVSFIIKKLP